MSQPRARIASQLGLALAVILAVVISGSTVFALRSLDAANLDTREEHLASEARLLVDQLNNLLLTDARIFQLFTDDVITEQFEGGFRREDLSTPAFMRRSKSGDPANVVTMGVGDESENVDIDIPTFLRRQAD